MLGNRLTGLSASVTRLSCGLFLRLELCTHQKWKRYSCCVITQLSSCDQIAEVEYFEHAQWHNGCESHVHRVSIRSHPIPLWVRHDTQFRMMPLTLYVISLHHKLNLLLMCTQLYNFKLQHALLKLKLNDIRYYIAQNTKYILWR